jgi:hypothetical protein
MRTRKGADDPRRKPAFFPGADTLHIDLTSGSTGDECLSAGAGHDCVERFCPNAWACRRPGRGAPRTRRRR